MKDKDALRTLGYIDQKHIVEAEAYRGKANNVSWMRWGAIAACLCICIVGALNIYPSVKISSAKNTLTADTAEEFATESFAPETMAEESPTDAAPAGVANGTLEAVKSEDGGETEYSGEPKTAAWAMIGEYDASLNDADMAVNNGNAVLSNSLAAAIDRYGDEVLYRAVVEVFRGGVVLDSAGSEVAAEEKRLAALGYTVAHETADAPGQHNEYFTIHAYADQLTDFPASGEYGYCISLYNEYLGL